MNAESAAVLPLVLDALSGGPDPLQLRAEFERKFREELGRGMKYAARCEWEPLSPFIEAAREARELSLVLGLPS